MFEQSGTFKRLLNAAGHEAIDADIDNYFGETDIQTDLFADIMSDRIDYTSYDCVFAFFPCTWFSQQNDLLINGTSYSMKSWTDDRKEEYIRQRLSKRHTASVVLQHLVTQCYVNNVPLIVENPASSYIKTILKKPDIAHMRSQYGDDFQKITYWFLYHCEHKAENLQKITSSRHSKKHITTHKHHSDKQRKIERSLISPVYAANLLHSIIVKGRPLL